MRKTIFEKKPPRRDRNIRTPVRDKSERSTHPLLPLQTTWTCQNPAPKDTPNLQPRISFCQEMPLHRAHWFDPGTSSWLDGHWSTASCGEIISCSAMVRSTSQAARSSARGCDTVQHDWDVWWNRHSQGCASSGFPCWNRGCEWSDAIPGARGAHVDRWKTTVHSAVDHSRSCASWEQTFE